MVQFKTRDELLTAVVDMLARRPEANIMLLVESPVGLEFLQTQQSFIWSFGVLAAAEKMFDERYRASMEPDNNKKLEDAAEADVEASIASSTKGPN